MANKEKFQSPDPPEHAGALGEIPADVQDKWRRAYADAYQGAGDETDEITKVSTALREANRLVRVKEPKSHEEAASVPDWQLMLKQEIEYKDLPVHAQREVKIAKGRTSGTYLRVYTTDGREYFFAKPEKPAKKKGEESGAA